MRNYREDPIHIAIVDWLRVSLPHGWLVHHSANGGRRTKREADKFKAMGLLPGYPDIVIHGVMEAPGPLSGCASSLAPWTGFLEVKAPEIRINYQTRGGKTRSKIAIRAGEVSGVQSDMHDRLIDCGFQVEVVTSITEARAVCRKWRLPIRDVTDGTLLEKFERYAAA